MKKLIMLAILFLTAACESPTGNFFVHEKITFKRKTVLGNTRYITVRPGQYGAKANITDNKIKLKLSGIKKKIKFTIPSNAKIPRGSGEIKLKANQIGQKFDLEGRVVADTQRSRLIREREDCSVTRYEQRCHRDCDRNGNCRTRCQSVPVTVWGYKNVSYYLVTTHKDYTIDLLRPNTENVVASFDGNYEATYRDYVRNGMCMTRYYRYYDRYDY